MKRERDAGLTVNLQVCHLYILLWPSSPRHGEMKDLSFAFLEGIELGERRIILLHKQALTYRSFLYLGDS